MDKNKWMMMRVIICIGLTVMIWVGYFFVKEYKINRVVEIKENNFSWVYQVDSCDEKNGKVVLEGFAFALDGDSKSGAYEIILQDIESEKLFFPKTKYVSRMDVNDYFLCDFDYTETGFVVELDEKKFDIDKCYEILLRVSGEKLAYHTGVYILDGIVMYENPLQFEPLDVAGTDLEKIVENGVLRVYQPDVGMYVYQYEGDLYWIAEATYGFINGDTYIQCQLETTQIDKLPANRLENQWYWDNISFFFNEKELIEWNTGRYRVARQSLPKEYAISKIWTGNYIENWIWKEYFYPYYEFE